MQMLFKSSMLEVMVAVLFLLNAAGVNARDADSANHAQLAMAANVADTEEIVGANNQQSDKDVTPSTVDHSSKEMLPGLIAGGAAPSSALGPITSYDRMGNDC